MYVCLYAYLIYIEDIANSYLIQLMKCHQSMGFCDRTTDLRHLRHLRHLRLPGVGRDHAAAWACRNLV